MASGLPQDITDALARQEQELLTKGARYREKFDKIRERCFYSTWLFAPGKGGTIRAGKYDLFSAVKGDVGQGYAVGLTDRETNWLQKKRVPDDANIVIRAIHVDIRRAPTDTTVYAAGVLPADGLTTGKVDVLIPPHAVDVQQVAYGAELMLGYLTNQIPLGLLADFPAIGGAFGSTQASGVFPSNATAGLSNVPTGASFRAPLPICRNVTVPAFERRPKVNQLLRNRSPFYFTIYFPQDVKLLDIGPNPGTTGEHNDASGALEVQVAFWGTESFLEAA